MELQLSESPIKATMVMGRVIAALIAITGCVQWNANPTHNYHVYIDPSFTDDQSNAIMSAVTEWQVATGDYVTFEGTLKSDGPDTITFYPLSSSDMATEFGGGALGDTQYEGIPSKIYLINTLDSATFRQTSLHEVGHALGANHISKGNIMCADRGCASLHVKCLDVVEFCKHWGFSCDSDDMPVCQK